MGWYLEVLKKYAVFSGRARRKEYWMFVLFNFIFGFIAALLDEILGSGGAIYGLYMLVLIIPGIAVGVRRLHDIDKSGFYLLVSLIPIIGVIWLLVLLCMDGTLGDNKYGPNPKGIIAIRQETPNQSVQDYAVSQPVPKPEQITVNCTGCGAANLKQVGKASYCEYCGKAL